jgi:gluconate kinase
LRDDKRSILFERIGECKYMPLAKVISGFPGVGKSHLFNIEQDLIILDSDSSNFSWLSNGERNPDFPNNYITHIKENLSKATVILVSSHKIVRDTLREHNIEYTIVYPNKELKNEYIERYKNRGNSEGFIQMITDNWEKFIDEIENDDYPAKIRLESGQYLKDVFVKPPKLVMCNGICTSQLDEYCGMYMSNESCPACEAIWNEAHNENTNR